MKLTVVALLALVLVLASSFGSAAFNIGTNFFEIAMKPGQTASPFIIKDSSGLEKVELDTSGNLNIDGGVNPGTVPDGDCNIENEGLLRYESIGNRMQFCDGASWKEMLGVTSPGIDCAVDGGAWDSTQSVCYFSQPPNNPICPAGWVATGHSTTSPNRCLQANGCSWQCITGSHYRSIAAREFCSVGTCTVCDNQACKGPIIPNTCTAWAFIIEIGCERP